MRTSSSLHLCGVVVAGALLLAACGSDDGEGAAEAPTELDAGGVDDEAEVDEGGIDEDESDEGDFDEDEFDEGDSGVEDEFADDEELDDADQDEDSGVEDSGVEDGAVDADVVEAADVNSDTGVAGTVDLTLTRDDIDCSAEGLGDNESSRFTSAHFVVDGALGSTCFGEGDPTLTEAWQALSVITPSLQLADLGVFGAFSGGDEGDEVTLAFVNTLDDDGTLFQMSINLESYRDDPNEALLTMAHEFSHVFTALPSQIDRSAESADGCTTYDNGEGCFFPDSLMAQWIELFWGDGLIDEIDPNTEPTGSEGQDRCDVNPGFLGAYAASNPEEDFAESFSAFVFQLDAGTDAVQEKLDWMAEQPGLAEFRERAIAAGVGPLENNFDPCGEA